MYLVAPLCSLHLSERVVQPNMCMLVSMRCCLGCRAQTHWMWSSAAWGEAESCCFNRGRDGEHAPITHEPLLDILFVSTSIRISRGPMAAEEVVILSQKQLAQKQHITALSNPLLVPCRHLLSPLQLPPLPLSLALYHFPSSFFSHQ